jgi:hypothetical protein
MKFIAVSALLLCCISAAFAITVQKEKVDSVAGPIWKNCGAANDHLQIKNIDIVPNPPVAGSLVNITFVGTLGTFRIPFCIQIFYGR